MKRVFNVLFAALPIGARAFIFRTTGFAGWWTQAEVDSINARAKARALSIHSVPEGGGHE